MIGSLAAILSTPAVAITSGSFTYSSPQTGFLSIHPADLSPVDSRSANDYAINFFSGSLTSSLSSNACFSRGVHLPQQAQLKRLVTYYRSGARSDVAGYLVRNNLATDGSVVLVSQGPIDDSGSRKSISTAVSTSVSVVRNDLFSYAFAICLGAGDSFEGSRIEYTFTSAGD
jgi:hypothetical protein